MQKSIKVSGVSIIAYGKVAVIGSLEGDRIWTPW